MNDAGVRRRLDAADETNRNCVHSLAPELSVFAKKVLLQELFAL